MPRTLNTARLMTLGLCTTAQAFPFFSTSSAPCPCSSSASSMGMEPSNSSCRVSASAKEEGDKLPTDVDMIRPSPSLCPLCRSSSSVDACPHISGTHTSNVSCPGSVTSCNHSNVYCPVRPSSCAHSSTVLSPVSGSLDQGSPQRRTRRTSGRTTRRMASSLRRMGDELYLRRMPLHSLAAILVCQMMPGGWGRKALSRWLVPESSSSSGEEEEEEGEEEASEVAEKKEDACGVMDVKDSQDVIE